MNKEKFLKNEKWLDYLDYLSIVHLKYVDREFCEMIEKTERLKNLDLRNVNYKKNENLIILNFLKRRKDFKEIIFEFKEIEREHLIEIPETVQKLVINGCHTINTNDIENIKHLSQLKWLEFYWMPQLKDEALLHLLDDNILIEHLNLSGCKGFTTKSLEYITTLRSLKYLVYVYLIKDLTRCVGTTDNLLIKIIEKCKNLEHLNLYALPYLKCDFLEELNEDNNLTFLDLCGNQSINDEILSKNIHKLTKLTYLNLTWCSFLTDQSLALIGDYMNDLELISVHGLTKVTDKFINNLLNNSNVRYKLTCLDVNGCIGIENRSKEHLIQLFPNLKVFKHHF